MRFVSCLALVLVLLSAPALAQNGGGFIRSWLVCGSIQRDGANPFDVDFLGGMKVAPSAGQFSAGREWRSIRTESDSVDLRASKLPWNAFENVACYAHVYVRSDAELKAQLWIGSDDGVRVWLNDEEVDRFSGIRGCTLDEDKVSVVLRAGWNRLLMKVINGGGDWRYAARFVDANGQPLSELSFETENPEAGSALKSPAKPDVQGFRISDRLTASGEELVAGMTAVIVNTGTEKLDASRVDLCKDETGRKVIAACNLSEPIGPGHEARIQFAVPYSQILAVSAGNGSLWVVTRSGEQFWAKKQDLPDGMEVLRTLFRPIRYDWTARLDDGARLPGSSLTADELKRVAGFETASAAPVFLAGFRLAAGIDVGMGCVGRILVNGKELKDHFSGDSGDIAAVGRFEIGAKLPIDAPLKPGGKPEYRSGWLRAYYPKLETYLSSYALATKMIPGLAKGNELRVEKMLRALSASDLAALDVACSQALSELAPANAKAKSYTVHLVGHAHLDLAYKWRMTESMQAAKDTFAAALKNMDRYPDFKFSQSQPAEYQWVEEQAPKLFEQVKQRVREGRWEPVGGMWSEGDSNMPSGESMVRQFLYGQRYFKEKLGTTAKVGWGPDTFGHAWSLPQILRKSGVDYYYYMRGARQSPAFWWEGIEGSRVLAYSSPYQERVASWFGDRALEVDRKTGGSKETMISVGIGNHGGGPTERDLDEAVALKKTDPFPRMKMDRAEDSFRSMESNKVSYPVINEELNPIFEGCYTSEAESKKLNRACENLLPTAEAFSTIAQRYGERYPSRDFDLAWKNTLFNQFHDILDGSGIHSIYADQEKMHAEALALGNKALSGALGKIAGQIGLPGESVLVFNPLPWPRTEVVEVTLPAGNSGVVGNPGDYQRSGDKLVFLARDVPAMGYAVFPIHPDTGAIPYTPMKDALAIDLDAATGCLRAISDRYGRQVLAEGALGDVLTLLPETGNAWGVGKYLGKTELNSGAVVEKIETGPVRTITRITHRQGDSRFTQELIQYAGVPRLDIRYKIHWQEAQTMLKAAFPLNLEKATARFEIPFGSITRPTDGKEVVTQKWVDLSTDHYGVTILNDGRHGVDVNGSTVRMSLLRGSRFPDTEADLGDHEVALSVFPHGGDWKRAEAPRRGYEFNNPLIARYAGAHAGSLPSRHSYLSCEPGNVIVTALKKAEDSDAVVVRFYEAHGQPAQATIRFDRPVLSAMETDNMEWAKLGALATHDTEISCALKPWEYKTVIVRFGR